MDPFTPTIEISTIKTLLMNFDWKLIKQEITEDLITLTITKDPRIPHTQTEKVK